MRPWIQALTLSLALVLPGIAMASVQTGKVMMVMENQLSVANSMSEAVRHFDISTASIYRNGLPVPASKLALGDWVTVTTEKLEDGRDVVTLVEAGSDR